jgi:putative ABC transport system permease protein
MGLFGMTVFMTAQRRKEIGVRKVIGASVSGLMVLLTKDFLKLILIALLIASPVAWWTMNSWLDGYAYRIKISSWIFPVTGILVTVIALFTMSTYAFKAAVANPVKALRTN